MWLFCLVFDGWNIYFQPLSLVKTYNYFWWFLKIGESGDFFLQLKFHKSIEDMLVFHATCMKFKYINIVLYVQNSWYILFSTQKINILFTLPKFYMTLLGLLAFLKNVRCKMIAMRLWNDNVRLYNSLIAKYLLNNKAKNNYNVMSRLYTF